MIESNAPEERTTTRRVFEAWSLEIPAAFAETMLSGILAIDGHVLIATITGDDIDWTRRVWRSIRSHSAGGGLETSEL